MKLYSVGVVGATGLVGRKIIQILEERNFPVASLRLLASSRSLGKEIPFANSSLPVEELTPRSFTGLDIAIFSAGGTTAKEFAPYAVSAGAVVIDNSSAFRMDPEVPLVVPEVNRSRIFHHKGIIANPNCSTIQMVVALKPLHDRWRARRVIVSTYQSVTGAGKKGVDQLAAEIAGDDLIEQKFPHPIAYNAIPHVDIFHDDGYTREEYKMVYETKKIMGDETIMVSATCVRIPTMGGHSESVNVEFELPFALDEVRKALSGAPGVVLQDDVSANLYPMPLFAHEKDDVFVGRIRRDETIANGLNLWIVSDNLRKGAATNAVQIAEELIRGK